MRDGLPRELRAFESLARTAAASDDPATIVECVAAAVRDAFGLARTSVLAVGELATRHPLVEEASRDRHAVCDGSRVAVPVGVDGELFGYLIGDDDGAGLDLGDDELALVTTLARVAAVFVAQAARREKLERSLDARTSFVSLASHELRTPLAVAHGVVATLHLRGDALTPEQLRELRATAFEQTSRLTQLTDQLLDLSRLESGQPRLAARAFRPRALVDELLLRVAPDRRRDVRVEIDPGLELETDPDALERVVSNLIVNALRYGRPPVCVRAEAGRRLRVVVEDAGSGIDPELVPRLFDRFSRGSSEHGGTGLGLAIARSYAEALGGRLVYEPVEPHGARFALDLPARASAPLRAPSQ